MVYANKSYHDKINVVRLVSRLQKTVLNSGEWEETDDTKEKAWLKVQGVLQKVKYARKLLKDIEMDDTEESSTWNERRKDIKIQLDHVESLLRDVEKRTALKPRIPSPVLPQIPLPPSPPTKLPTAAESPLSSPSLPLPIDDLLLSPPDSAAFSSSGLVSPNAGRQVSSSSTALAPSSSSATARRPAGAGINSLHEELSEQFAVMAAQLKRNAQHFSESLAADQGVVKEAQEKIEGNFGFMQKERVRLRDHRGKSGSTTWLVVGIILVVLALFVLMVMAIRFT